MKRKIAQFYVRYGRGEALLNIFVELLKISVYFGALSYVFKDWFGFSIPKWIMWSGVMGYAVVCYILGYLDEKYGIWKMQNSYLYEELTPYFSRLEEKIDRLSIKKSDLKSANLNCYYDHRMTLALTIAALFASDGLNIPSVS